MGGDSQWFWIPVSILAILAGCAIVAFLAIRGILLALGWIS